MLHPRLTPVGDTIGGSTSVWAGQIGTYGMWDDLQVTTRWGDNACGMYEAQWSMPLPPDFESSLLRRGTIVELMDGPRRLGSPLILTEPEKAGRGDDSWKFTASGIGREVEGENSFSALDSGGHPADIPSEAVDQAIARSPGPGLQWAGRDATVPTFAMAVPEGELITVGALLNLTGQWGAARWGVGQDNLVRFMYDPTEPSYHVTPGVASLGVADDDYATVVLVRYLDNVTHAVETAAATSDGAAALQAKFGRREYVATITDRGEIPAATAQLFADGILARSKGRLGWTNGLTVTSNEILTAGGVPADLSKVAEDVGTGCMVRLHGIFNDLLDYNGQTWLDIIIGEARYTDGAQTIDLNPLGMAARDLAHIVEEVTGSAA